MIRTTPLLTQLLLALLFLGLLGLPVGCNGTPDTPSNGGDTGADNRDDDTESATRTAKESKDASGFEEVFIETSNGSVSVICADDTTSVDAEASITAKGPSSAEAARRAEAIQLVAEADPNTPSRLHVRVEFPGGRAGINQQGEVTVTMPKDLNVKVKAANSWVRVSGCGKDVDVKTNKKDVTVIDIGGSVTVRTQEAAITALRIGGNVDLLTVSGAITLKEFGGQVKLKTSYAPIDIDHPKPPSPIEIEAVTSGDTITCKLPGHVEAALTLTAPNGQVQAEDLDEDMKIEGMITSKDQVRCKINGGGEGQVELTANNGRVVFEIKEFTKPANK